MVTLKLQPVHGFRVLPNSSQESVFFGITVGCGEPAILRKDQVEHVGSYDHIVQSLAYATYNDDGRLIKVVTA